MKKWFLMTMSVFFSAFIMLGCSKKPAVDDQGNPLPSNMKPFGKDDLAGNWPFVAEKGYLRCDFGALGFETPIDKTVYTLTARSSDIAEEKGLGWIRLTPSEFFWLNDPADETAKISLDGLVSEAKKLCD